MCNLTLTAVLLVGGRSRRMGRDKATLVIAGEPLWARQLRVLRALQPASLLVSARERPAWCPPEIETVLDEEPSRGPLSGLASALNHTQASHLLVLAVDLPRMTTAHLLKLYAAARPGCGVVPVRDGRFEPLCALYPMESAALAAAALKGDNVSLQSFVRTLQSENMIQPLPVSPVEDGLYHNLNTPGDL